MNVRDPDTTTAPTWRIIDDAQPSDQVIELIAELLLDVVRDGEPITGHDDRIADHPKIDDSSVENTKLRD